MNDYHWLLPNSKDMGAVYDAWVNTKSVVIKVDPEEALTSGRTVHFVLSYLP